MRTLSIVSCFLLISGCLTAPKPIPAGEVDAILAKLNDPFLSEPQTVEETELRELARSSQSDTIGRVYYIGRTNNLDHFIIGWNVGAGVYRLRVPTSVTKEPMPYTKDSTKWILVGPHSPETRWLP
jgi:hypothetical protein